MDFKIGDRVICIDNSINKQLKLHKQYIIEDISCNLSGDSYIIIDNYSRCAYRMSRFILDKQYYRKQKIKQLRNGI
jgi:hypothetical protein